MIKRLWFSSDQKTLKGMNPDTKVAVGMFVHPKLPPDPGLDIELLLKLPSQTRLQALPAFALAAGELPKPPKQLAFGPPADEHLTSAPKDRRRYSTPRDRSRRTADRALFLNPPAEGLTPCLDWATRAEGAAGFADRGSQVHQGLVEF